MTPRTRMTYPAIAFTLALLCLPACGSSSGTSSSGSRSASRNGSFTMAISPWIGYGPGYIAQKQGFFAKEGGKVNLVNFSADAPLLAALARGKVDGSNLSHTRLLPAAGPGHRSR